MIENPRGLQLLYISNDRIGWNEALHRGSRTWIEVSFSGVLLGKYELKTTDRLSLMPLTMTARGNVYAMIFKSPSARFAVLDRSRGVWQKIVGDPGGVLIGSEGDNLVFLNRDGGWTTLKFAVWLVKSREASTVDDARSNAVIDADFPVFSRSHVLTSSAGIRELHFKSII